MLIRYFIFLISFSIINKDKKHKTSLFPYVYFLLIYFVLMLLFWAKNLIFPSFLLIKVFSIWVFFLTTLNPIDSNKWASLVVQLIKNLCAMQETRVQFLGWEDPLEKEMATHSSILAWRIHGQRSLAGYSLQGCKNWTWLSHNQTSYLTGINYYFKSHRF